MKEDRFDALLRREMKKETEHIEVSDFLKTRIDMEITGRQEELKMKKKINMKKYIAVAACVCLMVPVGIFAGGKVSSYMSSTNAKDYSNNWEDLSKMKKEAGIEPDVIKVFSNGYRYDKLAVIPIDAMDDSGNKMFKIKELEVTYKNKEGNHLSCYMSDSDKQIEEERKADQSAEYGGVEVKFYEDTYKFVPADYEKTAEDQQLESQGNYYISYGSDKVEVQENSYVSWEKDGIDYKLMGFDIDVTPQELLAMAGEIIQK